MNIEKIRTENLRVLAENLGGGTALARAVGKQRSMISQWMNNNISKSTGKPIFISSRSCREIERTLGLPERWMDAIRQGEEGPMRVNGASDPAGKAYRVVPLYNRPKWDNIESFGEPLDWIACPVRNHSLKTYAMLVRDNAMLSMNGIGSLERGEIVFIDPEEHYRDGDLVFATSTELRMASIKRYVEQDGRAFLYTSNPSWQTQWIAVDETIGLHGVVIAKINKMRE